MIKRIFLFVLMISFISFASIDVIEYYQDGCPKCTRTTSTLFELTKDYNLTIEGKDIQVSAKNFQEMFDLYTRFGIDNTTAEIPTSIINNKSLVKGEVSKVRWEEILNYCRDGGCKEGVFTKDLFISTSDLQISSEFTLIVLIGAALVDSINPCTIAVMVMLLGVILLSKGKKDAMIAGLVFAGTIYIMYLLMGIGILHAVSSSELTNSFYLAVTVAALLLAILEIRAYFKYRPGFLAIEMPMFLRPHTKKIMQGATSIPGVIVAAVVCSFFLLPCSSGPYLLVLGMLAKSATLQAIFYLLLYNFIFILPMIIIAFAVYAGRASAEDVHDLKEKYIREIHLFSGLILFALFLIMAYQLFNGI